MELIKELADGIVSEVQEKEEAENINTCQEWLENQKDDEDLLYEWKSITDTLDTFPTKGRRTKNKWKHT